MEMARQTTPMLSGWGRLSKPGKEVFSEDLRALSRNAVLSRGLGRSYGDSALPPPGHLEVATTTLADRVLAFDETSGILRAEAGLSLRELNRLFLPRRWFTPVTPGTQDVTIGGMVAADVHGKNHHVDGTFGRHVCAILLRVADGRLIECSPSQEPELFWASVGGMGLTGHILEVAFQMRAIASPWIYEERETVPDIETLAAALKDAAPDWPFTVGWLDYLGKGRGILVRGRWAEAKDAPSDPPLPLSAVTVPFELPNWVLNRWSMRAFNIMTYYVQGSSSGKIVHPEGFFYPLDKVHHWNRIYGRRGFIQYQCVLPSRRAAPTPRGGSSMCSTSNAPPPSCAWSKTARRRARECSPFRFPGSLSLWTSPSTRARKRSSTASTRQSSRKGGASISRRMLSRGRSIFATWSRASRRG